MVVQVLANMTVADYCDAMDRKDITVNREYQRSDKVWPDAARSFLIESILIGYPLPKIYLHSVTDVKQRKTRKEIVDGQQRSKTILDFFHDRLSLSKTAELEELRGLTYSQLPPEWQDKFVSYSLSIDQLVGASPAEVRQIFRRMNSYTVPLNPEEMRNAEFQGQLKWFLYGEAQKYGAVIAKLGIFTEKALVRMQDLKLLAEITHALKHGITTTKQEHLKALYRENDASFPDEDVFTRAFQHAFAAISRMDYIAGTNLSKPYMIYSLVLALIHQVHRIPGLDGESQPSTDIDHVDLERRLLALSAAVDVDEDAAKNSPYRTFIAASAERTNVKEQRIARTRWFLKALRREDA